MFGKIVYISNSEANVEIGKDLSTNLMNLHIIFEDENKKILGEIVDVSKDIIKVNFLGEFVGNKFLGGVIRKPTFDSKIRLIDKKELKTIIGEDSETSLTIGHSALYDDCDIKADINDLFSNHLAIFGNTGSGKSCGVARILQNIFQNKKLVPVRSNILIFDAYGEYHNALQNVNEIDPRLKFKFYTTNTNQTGGELLSIPVWLLNIDDLALLLSATTHGQLTIIERMLKLVRIFASSDESAKEYKNYLIAKAVMTILYSNQTAASKRNDVFSILNTCTTPEFNLEAPVQGIGYVRKFRECFLIDNNGNFSESVLLTKYVSSFIKDELNDFEVNELNYYTLEDLEKALSFTLISEGYLNNENTYAEAITLKVRLHSIRIGEYAKYFEYKNFVTMENYIASLVSKNNKKVQIVNFNLEDVEDWFAKFVTKVYMRMLFTFTKQLKSRASIPFHIFLEEAHRYVMNDQDNYLIGYNIFERVAKEGRKYGIILNLISQRPVEISDTVISQCSNFIIFKMTHPRDIEYIKKMLPNISAEIVEKQKTLQPGTCVAFGKAFTIPMIIRMDMPSPEPQSSNCDVAERWK